MLGEDVLTRLRVSDGEPPPAGLDAWLALAGHHAAAAPTETACAPAAPQGGDAASARTALHALLRDALRRRDDGRVEVRPAAAGAGAVRAAIAASRAMFGAALPATLTWYFAGLARARSVARIGFDLERAYGSGFLVRGRDLADRLGDTWFLLTNAHVVSADPAHRAVMRPSDAVVSFEALARDGGGTAEGYAVRRVLWASGPGELDAALLELDRPVPGVGPDDAYEIAPELPARGAGERVYVVGHAGGGTLSFSVHDNRLLDHEDPLIHYTTATEPGSSGSPVFDGRWRLIGLHHAGYPEAPRLNGQAGTYAANEGIWIQAIRRALAAA